jgi:hypothetical protein
LLPCPTWCITVYDNGSSFTPTSSAYWDQEKLFDEKTRHEKSRDTVPLRLNDFEHTLKPVGSIHVLDILFVQS